eukprot:CAMPEP_0197625432 /NCGR_PEP_ID=MMETSP1338-20131121/4803_1 /TAXON_ID=43686 ORGANISM="Pelagodinium beii, Strain RCC1491" /NCGR_SAMPLE_ID=MMETSP1338 /ASSEMBLY_ACC=CAM_ASM_000754 /LENGTH=225 /DNA_ID=CAMNT_0043195847 /DNA_START=313 /DNA_END=990 /DNA_ORIENTATION=+
MDGSDAQREMLPLLEQDLRSFGLWKRTTVQTEIADPDGATAGCFRAHVKAWQASQDCQNLLVLEDDVFFENSTTTQGMMHVQSFLQSAPDFDLLLLGWWGDLLPPRPVLVSEVQGAQCIFGIRGEWCLSHAYVISQKAMHDFSNMTFETDGARGIDIALSNADRGSFVTVRPEFAFQRPHVSSIAGGDSIGVAQKLKASTKYMHTWEEGTVYLASGLATNCTINL